MHFEILVEDRSGKLALDTLLPKILREGDTHTVHAYRGIGRIPGGLQTTQDPNKRILLEQLPRLLRGYGKAFAGYGAGYKAAVIVVCDLDSRCRRDFRTELISLLQDCDPPPLAKFCIAEEEGEAWFLGDPNAIERAYPRVRKAILDGYVQDSICGTWEVMADALYPGGAATLASEPYSVIGKVKGEWAETITPHMDVEANRSPSFQYLRNNIRKISDEDRA
ncbi:MAG TPA: hypothetical protein VGE93_09320 [Bryobacteraceae bacterium]|nr:hypothetical protein [Acidobacteriaceae bacterium]